MHSSPLSSHVSRSMITELDRGERHEQSSNLPFILQLRRSRWGRSTLQMSNTFRSLNAPCSAGAWTVHCPQWPMNCHNLHCTHRNKLPRRASEMEGSMKKSWIVYLSGFRQTSGLGMELGSCGQWRRGKCLEKDLKSRLYLFLLTRFWLFWSSLSSLGKRREIIWPTHNITL